MRKLRKDFKVFNSFIYPLHMDAWFGNFSAHLYYSGCIFSIVFLRGNVKMNACWHSVWRVNCKSFIRKNHVTWFQFREFITVFNNRTSLIVRTCVRTICICLCNKMFKPNIQYNFPLNNNDLWRCYIGLWFKLSPSSVGTAFFNKIFHIAHS